MDSVRRANLGSQMNGGLRSPKGKRERHKSRSVLRSAVPLNSISNPGPPFRHSADMDTPVQEQHEDIGVIAEFRCCVLLAVSRVYPKGWYA